MTGFCTVSRLKEVNELVETCGYAAAALTMLPIPGSEIIGVMPLHVGMVVGIANHHGRSVTRAGATELILQIGTTVGVSLVGSRIATTAAKFVLPGLGGLIAAPFMFASTLGIGAVADSWFERGGSLSDADMRDVYGAANSNAKKGFDKSRARSDEAVGKARAAAEEGQRQTGAEAEPEKDLVARLKQAKRMHQEGLIDDDEFAATKKSILDEL
jgi:uncharacterized protein (DUF697 family)